METTVVAVPGFLTFTIAIVVFFIGAALNGRIGLLSRYNIPEAVTGGLLASLATLAARSVLDVDITFELAARDLLLLYFFAGIGLNARLADLLAGGRPFLILLALTVAFLVIQNGVATGMASLLGLPEGFALLLGSVSLIGGHGTTIAWAPMLSSRFGLTNALELGIAAATLGLVVASLMGGPIARFLIERYRLAGPSGQPPVVGLPDQPETRADRSVSHVSLLSTILVLNVVILIGYAVDELIEQTGIKLPLFVVCMFVAITLTNTVPRLLPGVRWPTRTRSLALVSDLSLNVFLAMSLMSLQLWALSGLGFALAAVLTVQAIVCAVYILFVVFPAMGRSYDAAVLSAGFTGIGLGATPTAIANMTAVTKTHGAAPTALIILPLVSAFFIDIANAVVISLFLR
jgi:ESS family glutamate:Na+ symporter